MKKITRSEGGIRHLSWICITMDCVWSIAGCVERVVCGVLQVVLRGLCVVYCGLC